MTQKKSHYIVTAKFVVRVPVEGEVCVEATSPDEARKLALDMKDKIEKWHGFDPDFQFARIVSWDRISRVRDVHEPHRRDPSERKHS